MKWRVLAVGLFLSLSGVGFGQQQIKPEAKLVRAFYKGDFVTAVQDATIALTSVCRE